MKPLTIEQLKALEVGDWVWLTPNNEYVMLSINDKYLLAYALGGSMRKLQYSDYGTKWSAYKNKEQAEKQCVICHKDISNELPKVDTYGNRYCSECYLDKCENQLLKEKKAKGEIVELQCRREVETVECGMNTIKFQVCFIRKNMLCKMRLIITQQALNPKPNADLRN